MAIQTPASILGLPSSGEFTAEQLRGAFRKQAMLCHPDKCGGKDEEFKRVVEAYETLCDDSKQQEEEEGWFVWQVKTQGLPPPGIVPGIPYALSTRVATLYGFSTSAIRKTAETNSLLQDEVIKIHKSQWPELKAPPRCSSFYVVSQPGLELFLAGRQQKGDKRQKIHCQDEVFTEFKEDAKHKRRRQHQVKKPEPPDLFSQCTKLSESQWNELKTRVDNWFSSIHYVPVKRVK
jgi:curved DNA-binding protein CbpA